MGGRTHAGSGCAPEAPGTHPCPPVSALRLPHLTTDGPATCLHVRASAHYAWALVSHAGQRGTGEEGEGGTARCTRRSAFVQSQGRPAGVAPVQPRPHVGRSPQGARPPATAPLLLPGGLCRSESRLPQPSRSGSTHAHGTRGQTAWGPGRTLGAQRRHGTRPPARHAGSGSRAQNVAGGGWRWLVASALVSTMAEGAAVPFVGRTPRGIRGAPPCWSAGRVTPHRTGHGHTSERLRPADANDSAASFGGLPWLCPPSAARRPPPNPFPGAETRLLLSLRVYKATWHASPSHMPTRARWRQVLTLIYVGTGTPFHPVKENWACSHVEYLCAFTPKPGNRRHLCCLHTLRRANQHKQKQCSTQRWPHTESVSRNPASARRRDGTAASGPRLARSCGVNTATGTPRGQARARPRLHHSEARAGPLSCPGSGGCSRHAVVV